MSDIVLVDAHIVLAPSELHENLSTILPRKLEQKYIGCNKEYGCVVRLHKIDNNYTTEIDGNSGNILIYTKCLVERILPEVRKIFKCTVHMIFNHGIFAQLGENIKILIPKTTMSGYEFLQSGDDQYPDIPIFKNTHKQAHPDIISKHQKINIEVVDVKYNNHRYNCIGKLTNESS